MKIAEALNLRADLHKRLEQIKARLLRVAKVQEGDEPAEDPAALQTEYEDTVVAFVTLVTRINLTNAATAVGGRSLTQAIAERDALKLRHSTYLDLAKAASITQTVNTRSEVRFRSTVSVAGVQRRADEAAKALRELDTRIQEANWLNELKE